MNFKFKALKNYAAAQGYFTCYSAISGATAGAIGYSIMSAAGWTTRNISYNQFIQSMALGNTLASIPFGLCLLPSACSRVGDWSYKTKNVIITSVVISGLTGSCAGILGSWAMGLLYTDENIEFTASAGAAGAAVLALAICAACCVLVICCFGVIYQCVVNKAELITIDLEKQTTNVTLAYNKFRAEQKTSVHRSTELDPKPDVALANALNLAIV